MIYFECQGYLLLFFIIPLYTNEGRHQSSGDGILRKKTSNTNKWTITTTKKLGIAEESEHG